MPTIADKPRVHSAALVPVSEPAPAVSPPALADLPDAINHHDASVDAMVAEIAAKIECEAITKPKKIKTKCDMTTDTEPILAKRQCKGGDKATPLATKTGRDKVSGQQGKGLDAWEKKQYTAVVKTDKNLTKQKPKNYPFRTGSFTVYNDTKYKQWRIKAFPGSRHTLNVKYTEEWAGVEKKIRQLYQEARSC